MKYRIVIEGEDLGQDVEKFVAFAEDQGEVIAFSGDEEINIIVDTIDLIVR